MWSKKMDAQRGRGVRLTKNLGSTKHYLGDEGDSGPQVREEKVKFVNEEEDRARKAAKERATVNYNFQDFLN
jgi:formyltetrahydrofolate hydrolase